MANSLDHRASYGETICPYCGVGCRLWAEMGNGKVLRVNHAGTPRLYQDGRFAHPDGKAVLLFRASSSPKEAADHEFPLVLTTGRVHAHWRTLTRTAKARQLWRRDSEPFVELHPELAAWRRGR